MGRPTRSVVASLATVLALVALGLAAGGLAACSATDDPRGEPSGDIATDALAALAERFPAARSLLEDAQPAAIERRGAGWRLAETLAVADGPWRFTRGALALDASPGELLVQSARGARVGVVREGIAAVEGGGHHLALRDPEGALAGAIFATPRGLEEVVVSAGPLRYRLELPRGWRLHQPARRHELVEVRDGADAPQLRFVARWAFDERGERHHLAVRVEPGNVVVLEVPGDGRRWLIDPEWLDAGTLSDNRGGAAVTALGDGRVLVVGGGNAISSNPTLDRFDPASRTFEALSALTAPRAFPTCTLLGDGRVLIAGGTAVAMAPPELELFDPATGELTVLESVRHPVGVVHTATRLTTGPHAGKVLLAGGFTSLDLETGPATAELSLFDPSTNTLAAAGTLLEARGSHRAVLLPSGAVLFVGGFDGDTPRASVERYDPATGVSQLVGTLPGPRHATTALWLPQRGSDGQLLVAGGFDSLTTGGLDDAWLYDVGSHTSAPLGPLAVARGGIYAALLPSGDALLLGGTDAVLGATPSGAERFDDDAASLEPLPPPPDALGVTTGTLLPNGEHLVLGSASPLVFSPQRPRTVDVAATMTTPMREPSATVLATGLVLLTEGAAAAELFDPVTHSFEALPSGPPGIGPRHRVTTLLDGRVLFTGGLTAEGDATTAAALFDPSTRSFTSAAPMLFPRAEHVATLLPDGRALVAGGFERLDEGALPPSWPSVEILSSGAWQHTPLLAELGFGQAMLGPDGTVWLWAGFGPWSTPADSAIIQLDAASGAEVGWLAMFGPGGVVGARAFDGRVFVASESIAVLADTELLGVASFPEPLWTSAPARMPAAVPLPSGRILVVDATLPEVWLVEPLALASERLAESAAGRYRDAVTLLPDGGVLLAGAIADGPASGGVSIWYETAPRLDWRPTLQPISAQFSYGQAATLPGAGLFGVSEGTSATMMAPANAPVGFFLFDDGGVTRGVASSASDTGLSWRPEASHFAGTGIFFASTMGLLGGQRGAVAPGELGTPCVGHAACASRLCVDGVCCTTTCDGLCEACDASGTCAPLAAGTAEDACVAELVLTCGLDGTCDGAGQCARYPDGTPCDDARVCLGGGCVEQRCDGEHTVIGAAGPRDCSPYRCSLDSHACLERCDENLDCVTGFVCDASGRCIAPLRDGDPIGCVACVVGGQAPSGRSGALWLAGALLALGRRRARMRTVRVASAHGAPPPVASKGHCGSRRCAGATVARQRRRRETT